MIRWMRDNLTSESFDRTLPFADRTVTVLKYQSSAVAPGFDVRKTEWIWVFNNSYASLDAGEISGNVRRSSTLRHRATSIR